MDFVVFMVIHGHKTSTEERHKKERAKKGYLKGLSVIHSRGKDPLN